MLGKKANLTASLSRLVPLATAAWVCTSLIGCVEAPDISEESVVPQEEGVDHQDESGDFESVEQPLFGNLEWGAGCNVEDRAFVEEAWERGKEAALTQEFQRCILSRVDHEYMRCDSAGDPGPGVRFNDPATLQGVATGPTAAFANKVVALARSANDLEVSCYTGNANGFVNVGDMISGFHAQDEEINLNWDMWRGQTANNPMLYAKVANAIWHEVMHTHAFDHDDGVATHCGYPVGAYIGNVNGLPNIVGGCIEQAMTRYQTYTVQSGSVDSLNNPGWSYPPGIYNSGQTDEYPFGLAFNNNTDHFTAPMGVQLRICDQTDDGFGDDCYTMWPTSTFHAGRYFRTNADPAVPWGGLFRTSTGINQDEDRTHGDNLGDKVSHLKVTPTVVVFDLINYGGDSRALDATGHEFTNFAPVNNNDISSIYIPPGAGLRMCDLVGNGEGSSCLSVTGSLSTLQWTGLNQDVSFIETFPVVTMFKEQFKGEELDLQLGVHNLFGGWNNATESMVIPPGLTARVCSEYNLAGVCSTYDRSTNLWFSPVVNDISSIEITATDYCVGHCGAQAPEGCWCDTACVSKGDCCPDRGLTCD